MTHRKMILRTGFAVWSALLLFFVPGSGFAQDFPNKPITIYCGQEAGATSDLTARALAEGAQKALGIPVVVDNKPGGGFTVAATLLANKKPDGYTLAVISSAAFTSRHLMLKVAYDPFKDFTYLLAYGVYPGGICVRQDSPFKTLQDLIEHSRKNPGSLSYSSSGTGSHQHLAVEFLAKQAGVKFKHVPFKGGAPACTALIGGHVDFTAGAGIHLQYLKQGTFRMLAVVNSDDRDPTFPQVPTLKDLGYKDAPPGYYTLMAPKGLPDPVFKKLEATFGNVTHSQEFRKVLDNLGVPFIFKDGKQLETELRQDYQLYSVLLKDFGLIK
jgi:tripartite-type tricarboxylate transporter receptor subunit TctC